jgi:hypothetical protein
MPGKRFNCAAAGSAKVTRIMKAAIFVERNRIALDDKPIPASGRSMRSYA